MQNIFLVIVVACVVLAISGVAWALKKGESAITVGMYKLNDPFGLFPKSVQEIEAKTEQSIVKAQHDVDAIIALPADQRTFLNTAKALDEIQALSDIAITRQLLKVMNLVITDDVMRKAMYSNLTKIQNFFVDRINNNKDLYLAITAYARDDAANESLGREQRYYLDQTISDFKRSGLDLSPQDLQEVTQLKKEIDVLGLEYSNNIASDASTIHVDRAGLQGLDDDFIGALARKDDLYVLGVDYPTVYNVMDNCSVEDTRKKMYIAFENRAYPANELVLKNLITDRDAFAKKLGYKNYADFDLTDQMAKSVAHVEQFMDELLAKATDKWKLEFEQWFAQLPDGIRLTDDGKLQPWNMAYVKTQYKKKHFSIDQARLAEYFPMDKTIQGLLEIYEQFFSLKFKQVTAHGAWHEDVRLIETYDNNNQLLGYVIMDLYPRPGKFTHACCEHIVPSTFVDNKMVPGLAIVVTNFPKATQSKPALLTFDDVTTFFHEFGHTLHALLARTQMASFSGLTTKIDFAEMPSQMFEEWLWDREILKGLSSHYKTGEPMSDQMIDHLLASKTFDSGSFLQNRLLFYAYISLELFKDGADKDVQKIYKELYLKHKKNVAYDIQDHMYAAFGHLTDYGAKYYCYGWSKVFALDLFEEIKKHGLLNPEIGAKYVKEVIGKGASQDPMELITNFLGRAPNQKAFLKDLGLGELNRR